jgi:hypothetical protein
MPNESCILQQILHHQGKNKSAQKVFSHPNLYPKNGLNELNRLFYYNIFLQHTKVSKWRKGEY